MFEKEINSLTDHVEDQTKKRSFVNATNELNIYELLLDLFTFETSAKLSLVGTYKDYRNDCFDISAILSEFLSISPYNVMSVSYLSIRKSLSFSNNQSITCLEPPIYNSEKLSKFPFGRRICNRRFFQYIKQIY